LRIYFPFALQEATYCYFSLLQTWKHKINIKSLYALAKFQTYFTYCHVRCITCHHGMASPQVADGREVLQIRRVDENILNKQPRTADKGWSSSLGVGCAANKT